MPLITYDEYTDIAPICPRCNEEMELHYTYHPRFTDCITGGHWICVTCLDEDIFGKDDDETTIGAKEND